MANSNAIVEKLKDVGLRHGEKAGVAIASAVFVLCIALAAKKETIDTDPEKIKAATKASDSNLSRHEDRETIIQRLEVQGIKDSHFAKVVDDQVKTALIPNDYKAVREWVSPEPGAGLIRDTPVLITASELYAYPGRGGFAVYELDADGNRIPDDGKSAPKDEGSRRRRKKRRAGGGMGGGSMMGGGMMGGAPKRKKNRTNDLAQQQKEEAERKAKGIQRQLAGDGDAEEAKGKDTEAEKVQDFKEVTKGHRWVAITGVLDHAQMVANYRKALKNPAQAHPNYRRLDLQRKSMLPDGTWSKWEMVNSDENLKVLENLPEIEEEELTPETVRPEALVDPLPFLKFGLWEKVHVASLVPKEKKKVAETASQGMGAGMMGGMGGGMMAGPGGAGKSYSDMMKGQASAMQQMMGGRGRGGPMGGMMGGAGGMGSTESAGTYWKSEEKKVMIRAFDFTVQRDTSYRYRVRIVVFNPNYHRDDVTPGHDKTSLELRGPWSEATDEVQMPPDVMPYAIGSDPISPKSDMTVQFQVIRFRPSDGVTVTRHFSASPGEIIGDPRNAGIPSSDQSGVKNSTIDFNSHQIVLDINANKKTGGFQQLPAGFIGPPIERPPLALLLRPDGSVVVHNQADDVTNEVRRDIDANYKQELKDSGKERKNSMGQSMMQMMGGMGGMSGMPGGGMGGGRR